ncbi:L,D-transpeptidase family protein [Desulforamulus aquiferis]|uniref:L,D-transpeptidase family protein n=1 Tax=Desulforamulus aquiferis TaxID=1397668 RepID=A0AAW7ZIX0_9FIRM|nr:L,D-transpeptidase family protein [Desulforamulus aquiferis]
MTLLLSPLRAEAETGKIIVINKKKNQLGYYEEGLLTKVFPVATGQKRSYTPEGQFKVISKIVNPPYYKLNIPGGSPYNPLGPRWLGISAPGGTYGIHGNNNPNSIGTYASAGCIRLRNEDIKWLYDHTSLGTPVTIVWNDLDLTTELIDSNPIALYLNNERIIFSMEGNIFSRQDKPYISLRLLGQILGYSISWNQRLNYIEIKLDDVITRLTPNSTIISINDQINELAEAPLIVQGKSYLSQPTIETVFNVKLDWNATNRTLNITSINQTEDFKTTKQGIALEDVSDEF